MAIDWKGVFSEAEKFHKIAKSENTKFDDSLKLDVASMAIEKYLLAVLFFNNRIPEGDLLYNYITDLRKIFDVPKELADSIMTVSKSQNLCTLDPGVPVYNKSAKLSQYNETLGEIRDFIRANSPGMELAPLFP